MFLKVSRSFAAVIRQLPEDLVLDVLVFYLVLRGLDTVEDDMTAFASTEEKLFYIKDFYERALHNDKWKMVPPPPTLPPTFLPPIPADEIHRVTPESTFSSRQVWCDAFSRLDVCMRARGCFFSELHW